MVLVCKKIKTLVKSVYYKLLSTSYIFTYNAWNYCKCYQFQGCRFKPRNSLESGERYYCYICRVGVWYHADKMENLTKIAETINNILEMKEDIWLSIDLTLHVKIFGYTTTKQVGKIVLVFVNGNILKIILIPIKFVLMIIKIRIKMSYCCKKSIVISLLMPYKFYLWPLPWFLSMLMVISWWWHVLWCHNLGKVVRI